jgi:hypothetical protein
LALHGRPGIRRLEDADGHRGQARRQRERDRIGQPGGHVLCRAVALHELRQLVERVAVELAAASVQGVLQQADVDQRAVDRQPFAGDQQLDPVAVPVQP